MAIIKKKFKIADMHCTSCAMVIDGDLEELNGVKQSSTNYAKGEAEIEFDPELVDEETILLTIAKSGYTAKAA